MIYSAIIPLIFWSTDPITISSFNSGKGSKGLEVAKSPTTPPPLSLAGPNILKKVLSYDVIILTSSSLGKYNLSPLICN